jgi:hypothetical protein
MLGVSVGVSADVGLSVDEGVAVAPGVSVIGAPGQRATEQAQKGTDCLRCVPSAVASVMNSTLSRSLLRQVADAEAKGHYQDEARHLYRHGRLC